MLRKYFSVVLMVLFVVSTAYAQMDRSGGTARVTSLGNNPFVTDPSDMRHNGAWLGSYGNILYGDLGTQSGAWSNGGTNQWVGFNLNVNKNLTLGAVLNRNDDADYFGNLGVANTLAGLVGTPAINNGLVLNAAFGLSGSTLGVSIAYASAVNNNTPAGGSESKNSTSNIGFNVGFLTAMSGNTLELHAGVLMPSATSEPAGGTKTSASVTAIEVGGRYFHSLNKTWTLVPVLEVMSASSKTEAGGTSNDGPSLFGVELGFGIQYKSGDFTLVGGPSFGLMSETTKLPAPATGEDKVSRMTFPQWNLGAEWKATDWLVARLGWDASTFSTTTELASGAKSTVTGFGNGTAYAGLGLRFGNFGLDATVNTDVIRQGLNNVAGGGSTFNLLSATYAF